MSSRIVATAVGTTFVAILVSLPFAMSGSVDEQIGAGVAVILMAVIAVLATLNCLVARTRSAGLERRVWRLLALGTAAWALGGMPYVIFLATGGDPFAPAVWSQAGFLLAYPFWYAGFWLLRQPPLGATRRERMEAWSVEAGAFLMLSVVVFQLLWHPDLPVGRNAALLVPVVLDLLLLAALYNALRRSAISRGSALAWFSLGFAVLAITDGLVSYLVSQGSLAAIGAASLGYAMALGCVGVAARRPLRITEAQAVLGRSLTVTAAVGLALAGIAAASVPARVAPVIWLVVAFLFWRLLAHLRHQQQEDTDGLTGLLGLPAFSRHLNGVLQAARDEQPALLVAVGLDGFGAWNAREGFPAGDALLKEVAGRLEASPLPPGIWARLGGDGFAWIGVPGAGADGRSLAEAAAVAAGRNRAQLTVRAGLVVLPLDASSASDALAAAEESLSAARAGHRAVVAFDRGALDGVELGAGDYGASLQRRRQRVLQVLSTPSVIRTVFQPIVALQSGDTVGFEALSRFDVAPPRSPDRWIAEAHAVGLGLELELECVRAAVRRVPERPEGSWVSVNVSADTIIAPAAEQAFGDGRLDWLVLEITEHEQVSDYVGLAARIAHYRDRGALVAVDDAGAGHSSLRHVTQLRPDFIKLDQSLVRDVHRDDAKMALLRSMQSLEREMAVLMVAEGVESLSELSALARTGVSLGQGHLFARPHEAFRRGRVPALAAELTPH